MSLTPENDQEWQAVQKLLADLRRGIVPSSKWMIAHPGTLELIECDSFETAMKEWFEGFNIPFLVVDGNREDFAISHARVNVYLLKPNNPT